MRETPIAKRVRFGAQALTVELRDGRVVSAPLNWYPRLAAASPKERGKWQLIGAGIGIHWPELDEDVSVEALLSGVRSAESPASFRQWRQARRSPLRKRSVSKPRGATRPTLSARSR